MSLIDDIETARIRAAEKSVIEDLERKLGAKAAVQQEPTISIKPVELAVGNYAVEVLVAGLNTEQRAIAAANHIQKLLCGKEIGVN